MLLARIWHEATGGAGAPPNGSGAGGQLLERPLEAQRRYYLHVATGAVQLGTQRLVAGDAAMIDDETSLALTASADSELLLFDLRR